MPRSERCRIRGNCPTVSPCCPWRKLPSLTERLALVERPRRRGAMARMRKERSFAEGVADGSNRPQRNRPRCEPENQRAPTEFHVDSADVRVLEFNELVSPADDPMQVIVTPPIRKSSAGCHSKAAAPPPSGARKHPSAARGIRPSVSVPAPEEPGAREALDIETEDARRPLC